MRSVTVREPEFNREQVALLLASRRIEAGTNKYGIPYVDAMDPANQFAFRGYTAPKVDWSEKAVQDAKDAFYRANPDANRNGHMWGVRSGGPRS